MAKVKKITRSDYNHLLGQLLHRLNPVLRGWCAYFRSGVSSRTFNYLRAYTWRRVVRWLRRKHRKTSWRWLRRRYLPGWWPTHGTTELFNPGGVSITRYRYRCKNIPTPWQDGYVALREPSLPLERLEGLIAR
jgi:RNA-directed DNA polymerase